MKDIKKLVWVGVLVSLIIAAVKYLLPLVGTDIFSTGLQNVIGEERRLVTVKKKDGSTVHVPLEDQMKNMKEELKNELEQPNYDDKLGEIEDKLSELAKQLENNQPPEKIRVKLYFSNNLNERNMLILNGENEQIANSIKYGETCRAVPQYGMNVEERSVSLKADLRLLKEQGNETAEPIGRIHREHFISLFGSDKQGFDFLEIIC